MDYRGKVIAGSILGVGLLFGLYEIGANQHNNVAPVPPQARFGAQTAPTSAIVPVTAVSAGGQAGAPTATAPPGASAPVGQPRGSAYVFAAPRGTIVPAAGAGTTVMPNGALVPKYDSGARAGVLPINAQLVPATDGTSTTVTTDKTAMAPANTTTTYRRVEVSHRHHYQKPGNIHVARGLKHTIAFAAKLPFRLRP